VTPLIGQNQDEPGLVAGLIASTARIDFGRVPFENETTTTDLGTILLSAMPTALPDLTGPDWPTVAYVPPDRIAITWTEPSLTSGGDLRVQRYRLCTPE
jgi:hypothetical protein